MPESPTARPWRSSLWVPPGFYNRSITWKGAEPWGPRGFRQAPSAPHGVLSFRLGATAVLARSQAGGPWDLNPTLLKHEGFCVLRPSLFVWILFHLEWVFKPWHFALKVSLLWRLVEISITFVTIVKEWVETKNISIWIFFFLILKPCTEIHPVLWGRDLAPRPLAWPPHPHPPPRPAHSLRVSPWLWDAAPRLSC